MVVQLFVTLGFIFSFVGQLILVALLLRFPLEVILRFEYHFCGLAFLCNAVTGMLPDLELKESFHNFFRFYSIASLPLRTHFRMLLLGSRLAALPQLQLRLLELRLRRHLLPHPHFRGSTHA